MRKGEEAADIPAQFVSNHVGFYGTIKACSEDFVVSEIDVDGVNVQTDAPVPSFAVESKSAPGSKRTPSPDLDVSNYCVAHSPPVSPQSFTLDDILAEPVLKELEQFAAALKIESSAALELSLGSFPDKRQRAVVHQAVRQRFPFLMTVTSQHEITVRGDPDYAELTQLVRGKEAEDFFRFIDAKAAGSSYTFGCDDDKEHRTAVHRFLNRRFGKLVETKSFNQDGRTSISVRVKGRGKPTKRTAEDREVDQIYTAFTLRKENLETLEAISYMATALGILPSDFTYAGIKDKRAVTYQRMVVKKVTPQRLKAKAVEFEKRGMQLSRVRAVGEPLKLGRLQGNHFELLVRDIKPLCAAASDEETPSDLVTLVKVAIENVQTKGFVNYYGPQRFGACQAVQSDHIGLALLKGDMVGAVRLFFDPEEGEDPANQAKRLFLQTDNAKEALALMPPSKARERLMLRAINRYGARPEGCAQAWLSLPHGMRVFYPHAYCSRVWNEAAAHRLASLGHSVVRGDLVKTDPEEIHVVTLEEEETGRFALEQVLLPMPGNTVKLPDNAMGTWYKARLARDGLSECPFRVRGLKLNIPGCYRTLLAVPQNLKYELRRAGDGTPTLSLDFDLKPSCYATVCLKEIMKIDHLS